MTTSTGQRETSAATTGLLVRFVEERAGAAGVERLLALSSSPHTAAELCDESRWFSYDERIRLFEALVTVLDDPDATFELGSSAAHNGLNPSLVLLLRGLGTPRQVFRQLPRAVAKFSTTSTMEMLDTGETHAVIRYWLHDGYTHSRHDCRYAQGLFAAVPTVFGLPPAQVLHPECESDGYPACEYHVTWDRRARTPWGRRRSDGSEQTELVALRAQFQALQLAATDLAAGEDLEATLERVIARACAAVVAPGYLCVVQTPHDRVPRVHSAGLDPERVAALTDALLAGRDPGPSVVAVDIATARQRHGHLAAVYPEGKRGPAGERVLLLAYAGHVAAVIDQLAALDASRCNEARARALLTLAHRLAAATDDLEVARTVAEVCPQIVGAQRCSLLRWDAGNGVLRAVAAAGLDPVEEASLFGAAFHADDVPELVEMLATRTPVTLDRATASPGVVAVLAATGAESTIVVPLVGAEELLGVVTVGWAAGEVADSAHEEIVQRLAGVADQAASALENVRLLDAVRHQSLHDALTGLPNRLLFARHLDDQLTRTRTDGAIVVLFCDLDGFKTINDDLGHAAGDELLRQVAARLRAAARPDDLVSRLSGDEFALVLEVEHVAEAVDLARDIVDGFARPFRVDGCEVRITTSVGVAAQDPLGGDGDALLRAADGAMYEAKQHGRNQVVVADEVPGRPVGGLLHEELRRGIDGGELRLAFQPVVALDGAPRVAANEALVRWQHPRLGLLAPAAFLPTAQEHGLAVDLDLWVLAAAASAHAALGDAAADLQLAVNLSAPTLLDDRLPAAVRAVRREHGLRSGQLVLEVIESRSLVDLPGVAERLTALRRMGVRIALDDFGTGFSTLWWLLQLPIDQIKIDRGFVAPLPACPSATALVRGVLALARELDVEVIAEGVESAAQLAALTAAGCDRVQGYLFGRPDPAPSTGSLPGDPTG